MLSGNLERWVVKKDDVTMNHITVIQFKSVVVIP